jgi:outer membrane protein OmpA-like peptidoglycan-associated protein
MAVFFPLGSSDVSSLSESQWRRMLEAFYLRPIQVHGYADPREGAAAQRLSVERAQNIRNGFIACGVDPSRVTAVGHGTAGRALPARLLLDPERLARIKMARVELTDGVNTAR